jgi:hypothetical protein
MGSVIEPRKRGKEFEQNLPIAMANLAALLQLWWTGEARPHKDADERGVA